MMSDEPRKYPSFFVPGSASRSIRHSSFIVHHSAGYAFVALMVAFTVMLIALAAALPSVYHESQREKEEELIFRGNEYARAIYLFQRQFQRYPKSVDELIRTNNLRFLRHAYKDPMTPKGNWRFIHVGPNGVLLDSLTTGPQQQPQLVGAFGQSPQPPSPSSSIFGGSQDQQAAQNAQSSQDAQTEKPKVRPGCEKGKSESAFGETTLGGALIAGVASCSDKSSIRIYNKKTKYEEWEFLGMGFQPLGFAGGQQSQQPQQGLGGQTNQPGQSGGTSGSSFGPGSGASGPGPTPPGVQPPPNPPLTDQPAPEQPQGPEEGQDNPPSR
jgi:type II secretory pathway pseudopilin PulG